ncbi:thioredoxin-disulfide reductase [Ancylomarina euxinus]|uniref:Thioredoxin reductase n=1 Tax=Ancylomarina euxinus TaxID=2283627 RepID=A0A425Y088_9BACT|nr:thioredoxin-disulfide reductase [Ancylomarina euxinus]MCZ4695204.1 thioredoxin-disulfide reductase [Ancylomarina euxinus]MUP15401.1 thioredoxin-disulfide reductase [Ancylomarina euxinus]RRG21111.1 thioredoxin-disulfide reductase [Ancylomarina euxinus]
MDLFKPMNLEEKKSTAPEGDIERVKCLIVGSGPAGYTAAIYAARANLSPVLIEGLQPGGQLTTTTEIDNFPGYADGVTGTEMMADLKKQAQRFGTDCRWGVVTSVDFSSYPHKVVVDGNKTIEAESVILGTGATAKYLGIESETKYAGSGVSACATCDGFFYRGMDVAVVGGGDTAAEEATYLAGLCNKVYLIVRKPFLRASKAMQDRVERTDNIEVLYEHNTKEITGDGVVQGATLIKRLGEENEEEVKIKIDGFFLAIGHTPNSDFFKQYIKTDEHGYVITEPDSTRTNVPGVFACGDLKDSVYRQAVTSAGSGCMAAMDAEKFLAEHE